MGSEVGSKEGGESLYVKNPLETGFSNKKIENSQNYLHIYNVMKTRNIHKKLKKIVFFSVHE